MDGNYRGISPVSFKKVTGSHTVTLRKSGYKTKSYTIYLYNDGEDITYSFTDLEKEGDSVSGNKNNSKSENSTREDKEPDLDVVGTVSGNNPIKIPNPIDEVITDEDNTKEPETPDESESEKKPGISDGSGSEEQDD